MSEHPSDLICPEDRGPKPMNFPQQFNDNRGRIAIIESRKLGGGQGRSVLPEHEIVETGIPA
ncbi:hypothetical protein [Paraburkholderia hospita]|uniref:hypothetical protein n=1 Tax=Paraburkholderia hospita TaxID=169430 RepID=UPI00115FF18E|nr:hypothetical protein [Paraburkholderia hospita]